MSAAFAIARREFAERRVVIWAALAAALLPFGSPLLPGVPAGDTAQARDILCVVLVVSLGVGATLLLGAGGIARDLAEGRMGFDFSRPVGAGAIWAGRFLGVFSVIVAALAIVAAPTVLAGRFWPGPGGAPALAPLAYAALAVIGGVLCLLPLAHAASISLRSKTRWLALDLVVVVVAVLWAGALARLLLGVWAVELALGVAVALASAAVVGLWIASAAQVSRGRTDLARGHRAQSLTLSSLLLCALLAASGYVAWVLSAGPRDLANLEVTPAPRGAWVEVSGAALGRFDYYPTFLLDAADGRTLRLPASPRWTGGLDFSADGRRALWVAPARDGSSVVWIIDLDTPHPRPRRSLVTLPSRALGASAVSPDARRLAFIEDGILSIHDLDSGRVEASLRVDRDPRRAYSGLELRFTPGGHLRLYSFTPRLEVYELDAAARLLVPTGSGPEVEPYGLRAFSPDGERLVVRRAGTKETLILDARSAAILAAHPRTRTGGPMLSFLADGRIVVGERDARGSRLHLLGRDGTEERVLELGRGDLWSLHGEAEAGKLLVTFGDALAAVDAWLADLATGELRAVAERSVPVSRTFEEPALPLFYRGDALVRIDLRSGQETLLAGRAPGR